MFLRDLSLLFVLLHTFLLCFSGSLLLNCSLERLMIILDVLVVKYAEPNSFVEAQTYSIVRILLAKRSNFAFPCKVVQDI